MSKVQVVRYLRPHRDDKGFANNMHGVTMVFDLDYETRTVDARWSVCTNDNFSKKEGISWALKNPKITFRLDNLNYNKESDFGHSLTSALFQEISGIDLHDTHACRELAFTWKFVVGFFQRSLSELRKGA